MEADVAEAAEHNQIVVSVVAISADLALGVFELSVFVFLLNMHFILGNFLPVFPLSVLFHVLQVLLLLRVELEDEL